MPMFSRVLVMTLALVSSFRCAEQNNEYNDKVHYELMYQSTTSTLQTVKISSTATLNPTETLISTPYPTSSLSSNSGPSSSVSLSASSNYPESSSPVTPSKSTSSLIETIPTDGIKNNKTLTEDEKNTPGALTFIKPISNITYKCRLGLQLLDRFFNNLTKCYVKSGLYNTNLDTICSKECFDVTVFTAKFVDYLCLSEADFNTGGDLSPVTAFNNWSNYDLARLSCTEDSKLYTKNNTKVVANQITNGTQAESTDNRCLQSYEKLSSAIINFNLTLPLPPTNTTSNSTAIKPIVYDANVKLTANETAHIKTTISHLTDLKLEELSEVTCTSCIKKFVELKEEDMNSFPQLYLNRLEHFNMFKLVFQLVCKNGTDIHPQPSLSIPSSTITSTSGVSKTSSSDELSSTGSMYPTTTIITATSSFVSTSTS